ncbi:MAG: hypothetical protein FJ109_08185 [Deltaproteobacteria bacterium]|nr:hypothetical protein [Deltaproteobacteria bacterium]
MRRLVTTALLLALMTMAQAAPAAVMVRMTLDDLVSQADLVVRGTVQSARSFRDSKTGKVMTTHQVRVDEMLKGKPVETVAVVTLGGELEDIGQIVPGEARLDDGEEVVLCLRSGDLGYSVVAMSQGKFQVMKDGEVATLRRDLGDILFVGTKKGSVPAQDSIPLDTFRELVRRVGK